MSEIKSNRAWREECESMRQQLASRDSEIAELVEALEKQVAHDKAVSYERCPDCDYGQKCSRESGCRGIKNHSPIASAVLAKVRKP